MGRWDETLHPRDRLGRFAGQAGGVATLDRTERMLRDSGEARATAMVPATRAYRRGSDQTEWANANVEHITGRAGPGDPWLGAIAASGQGWGNPTVGSRGQVDEAVAAGWTEVYRGVQPNGPTPATAILADTRTNAEHSHGTGIYGNGVYTSTRREVAEEFGKGPGAVVRMAINPDARVVDYHELVEEMEAWRANEISSGRVVSVAELFASNFQVPAGRTHPELVHGLGADPGRYAAMRGYDVIRVIGMKDGARARPGARLNTSKEPQYVVLNRTAVLIEDTP